MTEAEWLACTDPLKMLAFLRDKASDRKLRLFAVACCRRIWDLLADKRSRKAVEVGELFADGFVDESELGSARIAANAVHFEAATPDILCPAAHAAACAFYAVTLPVSLTFAAANRVAACVGPKKASEEEEQSRFFRDIFGNPYRPFTLDPAVLNWNDSTVVRLAQAAYDERRMPAGTLDNGRLAVLADALEEAGCSDPDILNHLRGPGQHVRGCWVVDAILGKT